MHNTRVSQLKKYLANSFQLKYLRERERERERERVTQNTWIFLKKHSKSQTKKLV